MASWRIAPHTGGEQTERRGDHGHAPDRPCRRSTLCGAIRPGAAGDGDAVAEPVEAVDGEDDVGGFRRGGRTAGADRDAHVGERQRRRVVDAVADHDRGAVRRRSRATASTFSAGVRSASTSSTPMTAPTDLGDVGPVAGDHHRRGGCRCGAALGSCGRASGRSGSSSTISARPAVPSTATNMVERAVEVGRAGGRGRTQSAARPSGRIQSALPTDDRVAVDPAAHAVAGDLLDIVGKGERRLAGAGGAHHGRGQHVRRHLVERGRRRSTSSACHPAGGDHLGDGRAPRGEGAGLVEQQDRRRRRDARAHRHP